MLLSLLQRNVVNAMGRRIASQHASHELYKEKREPINQPWWEGRN